MKSSIIQSYLQVCFFNEIMKTHTLVYIINMSTLLVFNENMTIHTLVYGIIM